MLLYGAYKHINIILKSICSYFFNYLNIEAEWNMFTLSIHSIQDSNKIWKPVAIKLLTEKFWIGENENGTFRKRANVPLII